MQRSEHLAGIAHKLSDIAEGLCEAPGHPNDPGTPAALASEILCRVLRMAEMPRGDLITQAKRLCDNLSREVFVYSFLCDMVRVMEPWFAQTKDQGLIESFRALKLKVTGD